MSVFDDERARVLADAAEHEEARRVRNLSDATERDRLLAALALRASSGWPTYPALLRQRVLTVIDGAAERVRDLLVDEASAPSGKTPRGDLAHG